MIDPDDDTGPEYDDPEPIEVIMDNGEPIRFPKSMTRPKRWVYDPKRGPVRLR
jgi:hypothetical protein